MTYLLQNPLCVWFLFTYVFHLGLPFTWGMANFGAYVPPACMCVYTSHAVLQSSSTIPFTPPLLARSFTNPWYHLLFYSDSSLWILVWSLSGCPLHPARHSSLSLEMCMSKFSSLSTFAPFLFCSPSSYPLRTQPGVSFLWGHISILVLINKMSALHVSWKALGFSALEHWDHLAPFYTLFFQQSFQSIVTTGEAVSWDSSCQRVSKVYMARLLFIPRACIHYHPLATALYC